MMSEMNFQLQVYVFVPLIKKVNSKFKLNIDSFFVRRHRDMDVRIVPYIPFRKEGLLNLLSLKISYLLFTKRNSLNVYHTIFPFGLFSDYKKKGMDKDIIFCHGTDYRYYRKIEKLNKKIMLLKKQNIVAVGKGLYEELSKDGFEKLNHLNNALDVKARAPEKVIKTVNTIPIFIFVGGLTATKGIVNLIKASNNLVEAGYKHKLHVIGEGDLYNQVKGLSGSQVSLLGVQSNDNVLRLLNASDYLVLPSMQESFGRVVIEAFSQGTPVIVTKSGGPEYLVSEKSGIIIKENDEASISKAMVEAIENIGKYDPEEIRRSAQIEYSQELWKDRLGKIIEQE